MVGRAHAVWFLIVVVVMAAGACEPAGPRPCRQSDQCDPGDICVVVADETVGTCRADDTAEGEGEGEGEGEAGLALDVQAGGLFACAIDSRRRVQCWGSNGAGQLGRVTSVAVDLVPSPIPGLEGVDALAVGNTHACALGRVGDGARDLYCWGDNNNGTLGVGDRVVPVGELVAPLAAGLGFEATSIDADGDNRGGLTCVATNGGVLCFGPVVVGTDGGRPVAFSTLAGAVRVSVATDVMCGFDAADTATCFRPRSLPGVASTTTAFGCAQDGPCDALDGGRSFDTELDLGCRIVAGDVQCGGDNTYGAVNPGDRGVGLVAERLVATAVVDVGTGTHHACAVGTGGAVRCWGHALFGATGFVVTDQDIGPTEPCETAPARCQPIEVVPLPSGIGRVVSISTHLVLSCVRAEGARSRDDPGEVACWGTIGRATGGLPPTRFRLAP